MPSWTLLQVLRSLPGVDGYSIALLIVRLGRRGAIDMTPLWDTGNVTGPDRGLLRRIEDHLADDETSTAGVLQTIVTLGSHATSVELYRWALRELRGYPDEDALPDYRILMCSMGYSSISPASTVTEEHDRLHPTFMAMLDELGPKIRFTEPIGTAERYAKSSSFFVEVGIPGAEALLRTANLHSHGARITGLSRTVMRSEFQALVDHVRANLAMRIGELMSATSDDSAKASKDEGLREVRVVVRGTGNNINVNSHHATAGDNGGAQPAAKDTFWQRLRKRGWVVALSTIIGGLAGVVGAVAGLGAWFGWFPWK